jgi:hypothetical protein
MKRYDIILILDTVYRTIYTVIDETVGMNVFYIFDLFECGLYFLNQRYHDM